MILGAFLYIGLYKLEIWVSRPLHVVTLFKGVLAALIITSFFVFAFKAPLVNDSRLTIFTAFALFFLFERDPADRAARPSLQGRRAWAPGAHSRHRRFV